MAVIGIDLGTTNSLAGVWQDGKVVLIPNAFGEYLTPSVVSIGKNQEVFVGSVAKEMLATVEKKLLTPYGLRTLAKGEPGYRERYEGDMIKRDMSYYLYVIIHISFYYLF